MRYLTGGIMPLKKNNWGLHKVGTQMIMDFGFERIMMNHIASEIISIIVQEQKMYENQLTFTKDKLTTRFTRDVINNLAHIVNSKIEHGIQIETVQKKRGSSRYFLKITGDSYFDNRLTPWALDTPEEYKEPRYTWFLDSSTGIGDYIWEDEGKTAAIGSGVVNNVEADCPERN
jgi:hypothetical protein